MGRRGRALEALSSLGPRGPKGAQGPRGFAGQRRQFVSHEHYHLYQRTTVVQDGVPRDVVEDEVRKALRGKLFGHVWRHDHHQYSRSQVTNVDARRTYNAIHRQDDHLLQRTNVSQTVLRQQQVTSEHSHLLQRTHVSQTLLRQQQVFPESTSVVVDLARLRQLEERVRQLEALL
jgi:hypothetical protein